MENNNQGHFTKTTQDILSAVTDLPVSNDVSLVPAPLWRRGVAFFIDVGITFPIILFFIVLLTITPISESEQVSVSIFISLTVILLFVMAFGYFVYFDAQNGKTVGKRAMGTRVVGINNDPCTFKQALIRGIFRPIDIFAWPIVFFNEKGMRLGDMVAKTYVARENVNNFVSKMS